MVNYAYLVAYINQFKPKSQADKREWVIHLCYIQIYYISTDTIKNSMHVNISISKKVNISISKKTGKM